MSRLLLLIPLFFFGCSALFVAQELSENYALLPGVECDAPEVVDGDLNTFSNNTRIVISLPERKNIRRIIIYNSNISNYIIYEYLGKEGHWRPIKSVKGNTLSKIEISTQVTTDKIRLFVTDTSSTVFTGPGVIRDKDGFLHKIEAQKDAPPIIQEIELYGFVDKPSGTKTGSKGPLF